MPEVEVAGAVNDIWAKTLASYRRDLSRKDLLVVEAITSPADVANHIEGLEARTHTGKSGAFSDRVHAITGRLTQFSNVIGAITSSNTEASLVWGCLKLLLTIVHQSSEEYEKICNSILAVSCSFPIIDLVTETFSSSELVCGHVADFYASVLRFWSQALKFYKRRRLFNVLRAWHDFDSEFGHLDRDMKRYGTMIEKAAAAVHMNESRMARLEQKAFNHEFMDAKQSGQKSDHHRDIVSWLAPLDHEATYFVDDLRSASESRHPGTCTWILDRPEFHAWQDSNPNDAVTRLLWLTGVPGAGKTVLSSFIINRCSEVSSSRKSPPILHFFFKLTDKDKNSVLAVTRSLLYQLYTFFPAHLSTEIISLRDNSGKERALSEQGLWNLFVKHTKNLTNLIVVLDALDECEGVDVLIRRVIVLLQCRSAKICVVSRKEENIALALVDYPHVVIGHEDVEDDICSYVTAEIKKIPRFQGKSVQQRMINALSSGHGGMFLWAYLMVQELKELGTVRQVDDTLKRLPMGLEKLHEAIITRLDSTLHKAHRELATKILTWIVCAVRPLRLPELQEILRFEIRHGKTGVQSVDYRNDDDDLLYSEKDIELACGALVISRNETLQVIHLSTKEILSRRPPHIRSGDSRLGFYVNTQDENPRMAVLCISYISTHLDGISSVTRPNLETVSRLQISRISYDSTDLVRKSPFINYASISWQTHLVDGKISLEIENVMHRLQKLLTYHLTTLWIELCVSLHQDVLWTLERSCKEIMSWADYALVPAETSCHEAIGFLWTWSNAVVSVINDYARIIEEFPHEIHYLDLKDVFSKECSPGPAFLPASYAAAQEPNLQEPILQIRSVDKHEAKVEVEPNRQLQSNLQNPSRNFEIGFMLYDSTRDVYFSAESDVSKDSEMLRVQDRATGRTLLPVKSALNVSNFPYEASESSSLASGMYLVAAVLCPAHTYLVILYGDHYGYFVTSLWVIEPHLDFQGIRNMRPWARRLHCVGSTNSLFVDSCCPLTVGQDGFFYCPTGQVHPERGICGRIPDCFVAASLKQRESVIHVIIAFSSHGQSLVRLDPSTGLVEKISWLGDKVTDPLRLALLSNGGQFKRMCLRAISQTARFMVYQAQPEDGIPQAFHLSDNQANLRQLRTEVDFNPKYFYFSGDERTLLGISQVGILTRFSQWAVTEPSFVPQLETHLVIPGFGLFHIHQARNICVVEEESKVILVNEDRVWYEVDLKDLTFKEGTLAPSQSCRFSHQSYCQRDYKLSNNGQRLVAYYITCPQQSGSTRSKCEGEQSKLQEPSIIRIELRFADLSETVDQMEKIELQYLEPILPAAGHWHAVSFSPDLSMVQVGPCIFDIQAPGCPPLSLPDSTLSMLEHGRRSHVFFSPCNGYLIVTTRVDTAAEGEKVMFGLFRICRTAGRINKMVINGVENLVASDIFVAFHPNLPLLLLTSITSTAIKVVEIDLQELKPVTIAIPRFNLGLGEEGYYCFQAEFSSCGSFCFLDSPHRVWILKSIHLEKRQAKMQIPAVWAEHTSYDGRLYYMQRHRDPTTVDLCQATDRTLGNSLRGITYARLASQQHTIAVRFTTMPSRFTFSTVYILVGNTGDDPVRVLFLPERGGKGPPEIKQLRVTLKQILAELEEEAKAFDLTAEEESSETESEVEVVIISADEDESEELDSD